MSIKKGKLLPKYACPLCDGHGKTRLHVARFAVRVSLQGESEWSEAHDAEVRLAPGKEATTTYKQISSLDAKNPLHEHATDRQVIITGKNE